MRSKCLERPISNYLQVKPASEVMKQQENYYPGKPIFDLKKNLLTARSKTLDTDNQGSLYDKDGNISGLVGIGHDITERKRVEAELQQSYMLS